MRAVVKKRFRDKYTDELYKEGRELELTPERYAEIRNTDVDLVVAVAEQETEDKQETAEQETEDKQETAEQETEDKQETAEQETEDKQETAEQETEDKQETAEQEAESNQEAAGKKPRRTKKTEQAE